MNPIQRRPSRALLPKASSASASPAPPFSTKHVFFSVNDPAADGTCCNRLHAAAPLAASDPIQASEAKAPLAESRGVCMALWTRMGFDVSEAVLFTCPEYYRRTGSRGSVDVRADRFGSEQSPGPRRLSALASGPGSVHGPNTGPLPSVGGRGEMGRCPPRWNLSLLLGRAARAGGATGAACRRLAGGFLPDSGALCSLGMAPGRRRGGRARRRSVALPVWAGAYGGGRAEWEARESTRLVSTDSVRFQNGADRGGQEARCEEGRGAPPTGGRF